MSVSPRTTEMLKSSMLEALKASFGIVAHAAKDLGIDRTTHYLWLDTDPEYKAAFLELKEYKKDFIESKLLKLISEGDVASTIFAAKTQLKDRGYIERNEQRQVDEHGNTVAQELTIKIVRDTASSITPGDFTPQPAEGTESGEKV